MPPDEESVEAGGEAIPARLGPFEVRGKLAKGGMGIILDAFDPNLDRRVAIKVLSAKFATDPEFVQRFLGEARAVARISHPNVASIYYAGSEGGRNFFAMEFVEGGSLEDMVRRKGAMKPAQAVGYILQAARGLEAAHDQKIIHRDVKPANLLVSERDEVKITDFGLAKMSDASLKLTQENQLMGSPHFMSPEQGRGERVDFRSDIYSLGATLYYLVTGDTPYHADTPLILVYKHQEEPVPYVKGAPPALNRLISRMMAKDPRDRFKSYRDLTGELERLLKSGLLEQTGAAPPPPPAPQAVQQAPASQVGAPRSGPDAPARPPWEGRASVTPPPTPTPSRQTRPVAPRPTAFLGGGPSAAAATRAPATDTSAKDPFAPDEGRLDAIRRLRAQGTRSNVLADLSAAQAGAQAEPKVVALPPRVSPAAEASGPTAVQSKKARIAVGVLGLAGAALVVVAFAAVFGGGSPPAGSEDDGKLAELKALLSDPDPMRRSDALWAVAGLSTRDADREVLAMASDPEAPVRLALAKVLPRRFADAAEKPRRAAALTVLSKLLEDPDPGVRAQAAESVRSGFGYDLGPLDFGHGPQSLRAEAVAELRARIADLR